MGAYKTNENIIINTTPSFETPYAINNTYNIDTLRDLFNKEKKINKDGIEILKIKDYPTLCSIIDAKQQNNNDKKIAQGKDFKRFFSFSKYGRSYIIDDIYDIPLLQGFYNNPIDVLNEYLICNLIDKCDDQILIRGINKLALQLGFVNECFFENKKHQSKLAYELFSDTKQSKKRLFENLDLIQDMYSYIPQKYKYRLNKALNSLKNKKLILIESIFFGEKITIDESNNLSIKNKIYEKDEFGDLEQIYIKIPCKTSLVDLSDEEVNTYIKLQKDLLKTYNVDSISDLFKKGFNYNTNLFYVDEYYNQLSTIVEQQLGYSSIFEAYKIYFHKDYIKQEIPSLYSKLEATNMINKSFYEKLIQNKENELNRKLEKINNEMIISDLPKIIFEKQIKKEKDNFNKEKKLIDKLVLRKV